MDITGINLWPDIQFPVDWKLARLSEFCEVRRGASPRPAGDPRYFGGEIPWFKIGDATSSESRYIFKTEEYVNNEGAKKSVRIPAGSLIVANSGVSLGFARITGLEGCIHDGWLWFYNYNGLKQDYLYYLINYLTERLRIFATGSTQPNLNTSIARDLMVLVPSEEEQEKIVNILISIDKKLDLLRGQNETLEKIAQTFYKHWFIDFEFPNEEGKPYRSSGGEMKASELGEIPVEWRNGRLKDILFLNYGKALKTEDRKDGIFPVVGSSGVVGFHNDFLVDAPGIVIGRKGTIGEVVWLDNNFYPIDTTFYISDKLGVKDLYFHYFVLQKQQFDRIGSDSAVPGLNRNLALDLEEVIPPSSVVKKFNESIKPLFLRSEVNKREISSLTEIRDTLLPKLMSGQIRIKTVSHETG